MKKVEKQNNPNRWIYCDVKSALNISVSIAFIRTLISEELFTQRWMLVKITGANKMYTTKRYKYALSVLNLKVVSTCLTCGKIFENVGFFYCIYIYICVGIYCTNVCWMIVLFEFICMYMCSQLKQEVVKLYCYIAA